MWNGFAAAKRQSNSNEGIILPATLEGVYFVDERALGGGRV